MPVPMTNPNVFTPEDVNLITHLLRRVPLTSMEEAEAVAVLITKHTHYFSQVFKAAKEKQDAEAAAAEASKSPGKKSRNKKLPAPVDHPPDIDDTKGK